jgi:hypothetical protein
MARDEKNLKYWLVSGLLSFVNSFQENAQCMDCDKGDLIFWFETELLSF